MSFEYDKNRFFEPQISHENEVVYGEFEQQMESFIQSEINRFLQQATEQPNKKSFLIEKILASENIFFKEREDLLNLILAKIEEINYDSDSEFEKNVARELAGVITAYLADHNISPEQAKVNFRLARMRQNEETPLDEEGVTYCSRYDDVVEIHIVKGLTTDKWKEALSNLLKIIQDDDGIKIIKMVSWVVAEKLDYFRKLGFTSNIITDEKELAIIRENTSESMRDKADVPWGEAQMTREEFFDSKILKRISIK